MELRELYKKADYKDKYGMLFNNDCLEIMKQMDDNSVDLIFTDIPYDSVNRDSNGLRELDKGKADIITFDLKTFLDECYRISKSTIIIFCGIQQAGEIYTHYIDAKGTLRQLIWQKTNPSPMNGQHIYLSGIENAVWFKKRGGQFFAHCKNTVFTHSIGRSKLHPTEKNHKLIEELIIDNSKEGDVVFDPCFGSASTCLVAKNLNRRYIGIELDKDFFEIGVNRMKPQE